MNETYETIWDRQESYFPHEGGDTADSMPMEQVSVPQDRKSKLVVAVTE
jgi:hypothetical protein